MKMAPVFAPESESGGFITEWPTNRGLPSVLLSIPSGIEGLNQ